MSETFKVEKTLRGWRASTTVKLDELHELEVVTVKRDKGPSTVASVSKVEGIWRTHAMHRDYNRWITTHDSVRWTEKEAVRCHKIALDSIGGLQALIVEAKQHYNIK